MSTIGPVSGSANSQWQLLQQLKASQAAASSATGKAVSGSVLDTSAASSPVASPLASTGTTGSSTPFDAVAAKLLSGLQSFLVNLQSGGGDTAPASSTTGTGASLNDAGTQAGNDAGARAAQLPTSVTQMMRSYSQQAASSADASLMASLQV